MPEHTEVELSSGVGEYLEAIYKLTEAGPVQVPALAERLKVTTTSANEMVRRLAERGLANYERYKGVSLTHDGRKQALSVVRRHRLWERFLTDYLGIPWDQVHDEACRLEHATSALLEERLADFLEAPQTCPHGYAMPTADGDVDESKPASMGDLEPGDEATVVQVPEDDSALLRYLDDLELRPSSHVTVVTVEPFDGPVTIRVGEHSRVIGRDLANRIGVRPTGGDQ
jgi:DtxR family transcriptional regulator, Mn-dependent transcriptional regulator